MKKLFAIIIIVGLALPAVAQISPYLEKGKSGFGLNLGYEQGRSFKGYLANLGYSYKGVLDLEANFYTDAYDKDAEGLLLDNAGSKGLMVCLNWWPIRKQATPTIGVDFGLTMGINTFAFSKYSYLSSGTGLSTDYKGYLDGLVGFDSRVKFQLEDGWALMPGYALVFDMGTEKYSDANGEFSNTYDGFMSRISVSLSKRLAKGNVVYFEANNYIDTFDANSYFEVKVGFVLSSR
jgi:hypothetical protein